MNTARLWTFGSILVIVALLLGTWFIGISPRLDEASAANDTRSTVAAQNAIHSINLASLKEQFENIDELRADLDTLRAAIPDEANLADLIGEVNALAGQTRVSVTSMAFADAVPYAAIEDPNQDPQLLAAAGSVSPESFFAVPVQVAVNGTYADVMSFVRALQSGDRLFLVHDLALSSGVMSNEAVVDLNITGQVFVLLDASDVKAPTTTTTTTTEATTPPVEGQPEAQ